MSVPYRIVKSDPAGNGWVVEDGADGRVVQRATTKREALDAATREMQSSGGRLQVHYADGRLESDRVTQAPALVGAGETPPTTPNLRETAQTVAQEGKRVNRGLDAMDGLLTLLVFIGAPVGAWLNPSIQDAAGDGWIALTFATFTWSIGCALSVVILSKSGLGGYPLVAAVSACFVVALLIAAGIGQGVLDISTVQTGFGPFNWLATVVFSAIAAYGPVGFVLSGGVGAWLGHRMSAHFDDGFLA